MEQVKVAIELGELDYQAKLCPLAKMFSGTIEITSSWINQR